MISLKPALFKAKSVPGFASLAQLRLAVPLVKIYRMPHFRVFQVSSMAISWLFIPLL
jgi:hypothetical protein